MENEEMKDRIAHIIRAQNLTAAEFAIRLGIQPSNISHLLSGRNNPSLDFVRKLKETFPEYNLDWIVFGKGPMTISEPFVTSAPVAKSPILEVQEAETRPNNSEETSFASTPTTISIEEQTISEHQSGLKKLVLVYDDNTFEVLTPR
ncbi:MAG: helix-turn-helix domain-containing protein [Bacteroidales bacterium]|nr:helix-turn-helix domain-containing protein [Bacteroidales bacterium]